MQTKAQAELIMPVTTALVCDYGPGFGRTWCRPVLTAPHAAREREPPADEIDGGQPDLASGGHQFPARRTSLSPWLIGAAAIGTGSHLLRKPEQQEAVGKRVMPLLQAYADWTAQAATQERRGIQGIREVMLPSPAAPSLKQQVAIVLARQQEPLLAREVQEQLLMHFAEPVPGLPDIRAS